MFSRKPEKVSPKIEGEHTLKVKLPEGSTARSKKLIAKQKQAAASAVGRLKCYHNFIVFTDTPPPPPLTQVNKKQDFPGSSIEFEDPLSGLSGLLT